MFLGLAAISKDEMIMICKNLTHKLRMRATSMLGASLLAVAAVSLTGVAPSNAVFAQDEGRQFSAAAGEKVNEALTLANSGQNQAAVNILQNTISQPDLNAYERSTIYQMLGQYSYELDRACLLYTSPSPRDATLSRMPSSA